jgi:hypothetical protein
MVSACHERIEARLRILEYATTALEERPEEALDAIRTVSHRSGTAGVRHTGDEPESGS